jgi:hypothetical protein
MIFMDSDSDNDNNQSENGSSLYYVKMAAWQELQEARHMARVNDELLEYLVSSFRWLLHYSKKNQIPIPEVDKITDILGRIRSINSKLGPNSSQSPT